MMANVGDAMISVTAKPHYENDRNLESIAADVYKQCDPRNGGYLCSLKTLHFRPSHDDYVAWRRLVDESTSALKMCPPNFTLATLSQLSRFCDKLEPNSDMRSNASRLFSSAKAFEPWLERVSLLQELAKDAAKKVPINVLLYTRTQSDAHVAKALSNGTILHTAVSTDPSTSLFLPNTSWLAVISINMSPEQVVAEFNLSLVYAQRWICWNL